MIIEKTVVENNRYDVELKDYVAEGELTVTITLNEYRQLIRESVENKVRKDHESWLEQFNRANKAEERVKDLEQITTSNILRMLWGEEQTDENEM